MVTWRERGAVGCSKCRLTGCRDCFFDNNETRTFAIRPPRKRQRYETEESSTSSSSSDGEVAVECSLGMSSSSDEDSFDPGCGGDVSGQCSSERLEQSLPLNYHLFSSSSSDEDSDGKLLPIQGQSNSSADDSSSSSSSCDSEDKKPQHLPYSTTKRARNAIHYSSEPESGSSDDSSSDESYYEESTILSRKVANTTINSEYDTRASLEIDRLLHEANEKSCPDRPLDPHGTLPQAKAKWGSTELLAFLEASICKYCNTKLGIYYERQVKRGKSFVGDGICEQCLTNQRQDNWTMEQAAEAFRRDDIISVLQNEYTPSQVEAGVSFYNSVSVTEAALNIYGSLWELQYALVKINRRRPRRQQK